jgi:hypothetical protein
MVLWWGAFAMRAVSTIAANQPPPRPRRSVRWLGAVLGHFVLAKIVGWLATTRGRGAQLLIIQLIPLPSTIGEYLPFLRTD